MPPNAEHGFNDLAYAALAAAVTSTAVTLTLTQGGARAFVDGWLSGRVLYLTITDPAHHIEIVKVTDIVGDELTVSRGQDGTTARAWNQGDLICQRAVAANLTGFLQQTGFRSAAVNPNGIYAVAYPGEKFYQSGPTDCTKRWFIGISGTTWKRLAGDFCGGPATEENLPVAPCYFRSEIEGMATDGSIILATGHYTGYSLYPRIYKSTDHGVTWDMLAKISAHWDDSQKFPGIAYGGGVWVIVGGDAGYSTHTPSILTSSDGVTWTERTADASYDRPFVRVRYLNGLFIALGEYGEIQTSPDGITWTRRYSSGATGTIRDVAYDGAGTYFAVQDGTYENVMRLLTSTDGAQSWSLVSHGVTTAYQYAVAIIYDSTHSRWTAFMRGSHFSGATHRIIYSDNGGVDWTGAVFDDDNGVSDVAEHGGNYVLVENNGSYGHIYTSPTGISDWTDATPSLRVGQTNLDKYVTAFWEGTQWLVAGFAGYIAYDVRVFFRTSTDLSTWTDRPPFPPGATADDIAFFCAAYGGPDNVLVGGEASNGVVSPEDPDILYAGPVGYSNGDDLTNWTATFPLFPSASVFGLCYTGASDNRWLAALGVTGIYAASLASKGTWTQVSATWIEVLCPNDDYSIIVACGHNGYMQHSVDQGSSWTSSADLAEELHAAAYGGGVFVVVGDNGFIATSPDGSVWTTRTAAGGYSSSWRGAAYDTVEGAFYIVGDAGQIQKSEDLGETWTIVSPGGDPEYSGDIQAVAFGGRALLICGEDAMIQVKETGGTSWTEVDAAESYTGTFRGAAYFGGDFVLAGDNGEMQVVPAN